MIFEINQPDKLHLVDIWHSNRYPEELYREVSQKFQTEIKEGNVEINRGLSTEVLNLFPDEYFERIYIDTVHAFKITRKELELYLPKMKKGGVIAGHNFFVGEIEVPWRYGVIESFYDFCNTKDWGIIYLIKERWISLSFAIRSKK